MRVAQTAGGASPRLVLFIDVDGDFGSARYQLGRWRGLNRWRGYVLEHRRSQRPYLQAGTDRVPVRVIGDAA